MELIITISKTSDGKGEYVQVISRDQSSINVVLIADSVTINDARPGKAKS